MMTNNKVEATETVTGRGAKARPFKVSGKEQQHKTKKRIRKRFISLGLGCPTGKASRSALSVCVYVSSTDGLGDGLPRDGLTTGRPTTGRTDRQAGCLIKPGGPTGRGNRRTYERAFLFLFLFPSFPFPFSFVFFFGIVLVRCWLPNP